MAAASCTVVTPVAPTVIEAVCVDGALTAPTLTLPTTDGITYTADRGGRRMRRVQTVTVTATLAATGVGWPATMPAGWTRDVGDDGDVSAVTFAGGVVYAGDAGGSDGGAGDVCRRCGDGADDHAGVDPRGHLRVVPAGPYDGTVTTTVTVTATLADGLTWGEPMPAGWT